MRGSTGREGSCPTPAPARGGAVRGRGHRARDSRRAPRRRWRLPNRAGITRAVAGSHDNVVPASRTSTPRPSLVPTPPLTPGDGHDRPGPRAPCPSRARTSASPRSTGPCRCSSTTRRCSSRVLALLQVQGDGPLVLRIGGDSADHSFWKPRWKRKPGWAFALTPAYLSRLRALVKRDRVKLIVDLNLVTDTPLTAAAWARAAETSLPRGSIVGFEVGNEPDLYSRRLLGGDDRALAAPDQRAAARADPRHLRAGLRRLRAGAGRERSGHPAGGTRGGAPPGQPSLHHDADRGPAFGARRGDRAPLPVLRVHQAPPLVRLPDRRAAAESSRRIGVRHEHRGRGHGGARRVA